jgi:lipid-A-disaccharide synthase
MDVAVTLPGTNTMELAALGVPMVVIVPMNEPEKIPLEGLPGLAGGVPFVGPWMKRKAIQRQAARIVFTALPNRRAGSCVVPEVRGCLTGPDIAGPVCELLGSSSERQRLSERLKSIAGGRGAASRLVGLIMDQLSISENA